MIPIARRPFLASLGATLLVSACGQSNTQTTAKARAAGGLSVYHLGNAAEPASLDPHHATGTWEDSIIGDLMMGLTTEDAKGEPVPGAATSWEISADGKTWTFHLRDHQWSDGMPVTAEDFVYGWRRILDPKLAANYAYYLYLIKNAEAVNGGKMPPAALGIAAPDAKTLVVTLEHPAPFLTQYLMHMTTYPVPRHVVEAKGDAWSRVGNHVGNGAFMLKEWIPNDHVMAEKNPKFFDAANVKLDRIIYYPTTDYLAALKRFRAGELDTQDRLPSAEIDWLRANLPETLHPEPILTTEFVAVNMQRKPFGDARVREALNLGVDRETLCGKIIKVGDVPAYGMVPPGTANYPGGVAFDFKSMPQADRVKRAQMLMTQAGFSAAKPLKTTMSIRSSTPDSLRIPAAIQNMWKAIYVDAQIVQNDTAIFYNRLEQGDFDLGVAGWGGDYNDATTFLDLLRKGNANNYGKYNNPKYDGFLDAAANEPDLAKRGALLAQAEAVALKDFAWIPTFYWVSNALVRPYVKGWATNAKDQHRARWISLDEQERAATKFG